MRPVLTAIFYLASGLLLPRMALAYPTEVPPYSISPEVHGMNITYYVKQDPFKIAVFIINHEKFPVICDANYSSGTDAQNAAEQTINSTKGVVFRFDYGRRSGEVHVRFVCIKSPAATEEVKKPATVEETTL